MKLTLKQIRHSVLILILLFLAGGFGFWFGSHDVQFKRDFKGSKIIVERNLPADKQEINFSLFWEVWDKVEKSFIDEKALNPREMVYGAIKGLVASLGDPYTVFLTPEDNQQAKQDLNGSFEGVGIQLGYKDDNLAVIAPLSGMPAEKAGVRAGDLILKIGDQETPGVSLPEAVRLIRGPKGTSIKLTLLHDGESEPFEILIARETIIVPSVEVQFIDGQNSKKVALLKLSRFGETTNVEWEEAVAKINSECGSNQSFSCQGVILDLRNNPGGYLSGSVFIASEFLDSGTVVIQEEASGKKQVYSVDRQGKLIKVPLIILINEGSASASEIVAGALQERLRVKLVGDPSFGKGTIQEAEDLSDSSGLHITVARWLLPSGESIDQKGLVPDFQLQDNLQTESDEQLEKAKEVLFNNN